VIRSSGLSGSFWFSGISSLQYKKVSCLFRTLQVVLYADFDSSTTRETLRPRNRPAVHTHHTRAKVVERAGPGYDRRRIGT
jgi:hypothetical protein